MSHPLYCEQVVSIPRDPPAIIRANDERALLYHARDGPADLPSTLDEVTPTGVLGHTAFELNPFWLITP